MHRLWWLSFALLGLGLSAVFWPAERLGPVLWAWSDRHPVRLVHLAGLALVVSGFALLMYLTHLSMENRRRQRQRS